MLISFIINCLIVLMEVFALWAMFIGWNFMGKEGKLESIGTNMFCYFTIDSNLLAGICCLITAGGELAVLLGRLPALPPFFYAVKFMGASAVLLTLVVTAVFLVPQFEDPSELFLNSNLFLHLLVPVLAALSFVLWERSTLLPFSATLLGVAPTMLYAVYYIRNVFRHLSNGKPDPHYDFYNFLGGRAERAPLAVVVVLLASYLLGLALWFLNRVGL